MTLPTIEIQYLPVEMASELYRNLSNIGAKPERQPANPHVYGDASLINVLVEFGPGILAVIAAFLLKPGPDVHSDTVSCKFKHTDANGSSTELEIQISQQERKSKQLNAASIGKLAQLTGLNAAQIAASITDKPR
ncbi:MAG TPA: hypothetical protein VI685_16525 [Candidatus Angelobacter sp.]